MKNPDHEATEIWTEALKEVSRCVPHEVREQVLTALLEKERARAREREPGLTFIDFSNWDSVPAALERRAKKEAVSLLIQVLTRWITRDHSKEEAARILFREHRHGRGSGWLPDHLDGMPGIAVDRKRCADIASSAGRSMLGEAATTEDD
jgi:hypothetical protein